MDEWDEEKLGEVVKKKHGSEKANATDIVRLFWRYLFHRLSLSISPNSSIRKKFSYFRFANTSWML